MRRSGTKGIMLAASRSAARFIKDLMHLFNKIAVIGAALCLAQFAPAQNLPSPDSVSLDKLGLMSTFPPLDAQRVDLSNSYK